MLFILCCLGFFRTGKNLNAFRSTLASVLCSVHLKSIGAGERVFATLTEDNQVGVSKSTECDTFPISTLTLLVGHPARKKGVELLVF